MVKSIRIIPHMFAVYHPHPIGFGWGLTEYFPLDASRFYTTFDGENPGDNVQRLIKQHLCIEHNVAGDIHTHNGFIIARSPELRGGDVATWSYRVEVDGEPLEWKDFPHIFPDFVHDWND